MGAGKRSSVGAGIIVGVAACWCIQHASALFATSDRPPCAAFITTTVSHGSDGDSRSMISRVYGTRQVCHGPGDGDGLLTYR